MVRNSITLGRFAGIEIGLHYSWLFVAALIAWSLSQGYYPAMFPGWDAGTYWLAGIVSALGLFASVLLHELSHSLVAIARGVPVMSITLFFFGGVATLKEEAETARDEFLIAIAGPLSSFALAGIYWAASPLAPGGSLPAAVLSYLAVLNALLAVFNLVPGFPLDGGRVLRAILWGITGSLRRATDVASYVGQGVAFLLMLIGVLLLLSGAVLNGLWLAVIGLFLNGAAAAARQAQVVKTYLQDVRVGDIMSLRTPVVPPNMSVEEFIFTYVMRQGRRALPVVEGSRLIGIVSITDVREVPRAAWGNTTVGSIMTPAPLKTVSPAAGLDTALQRLVEDELNQLPVVHDGLLVGMVSRADILRFLQLRDMVQPVAGRSASEPPGTPIAAS